MRQISIDCQSMNRSYETAVELKALLTDLNRNHRNPGIKRMADDSAVKGMTDREDFLSIKGFGPGFVKSRSPIVETIGLNDNIWQTFDCLWTHLNALLNDSPK